MKLLIIILTLLSERYLIHKLSTTRTSWFTSYAEKLMARFPQTSLGRNSYLMLIVFVLPVVLIAWFLFAVLGHLFFGFFGFVLSFIIFYYSVGPQNPFYPSVTPNNELENELVAGQYFALVHNQLFAAIFWFIFTGPLGVLVYRLISLCTHSEPAKHASVQVLSLMGWLPARLTVMLYLLAGHFQQGFHYYKQQFFSSPLSNQVLLSTGGLLAARNQGEELVTLPHAQNLVERALVIYLVLIAILTLSTWL